MVTFYNLVTRVTHFHNPHVGSRQGRTDTQKLMCELFSLKPYTDRELVSSLERYRPLGTPRRPWRVILGWILNKSFWGGGGDGGGVV
jgi:hypothetical protein